ncbi:putative oxidoreductase [Cupriavidus taiwanensis]|uniref:MaoC/PaaZ C-terminal domain-containing protein n=1 Tax=Cupriavidus taiwanensis TaxID=164546 RepID=UPI000E178EDD|nr:MaoC/PaaZ C-terminal domain-containing protein [Cupriavidus taiwanensis]SOZ16813.1 putative oxidoreductase [Cupriavidus taiwanensis]SOZ22457.1 putative oxidoreductase [Cupriavidus taiwanensis]SOZ41997.1 putative oxidoreductase [Cupriavidus taiwanensis]
MHDDDPPRVLSQRDFDCFAALSRDDNPIHCDPAFARGTHFGATVAHGMLLFSLLCAHSARQLPRPALPVAQTLMFPAPAFVGDAVQFALSAQPAPAGLAAYATTVSCVGGPGQAPRVTAVGESRWLAEASPAALAGQPVAADPVAQDGDAALYGLRPGQQASAVRAFTAADLDAYIALTGDANPFHADAGFARTRGFAGPVVPLPLLAGMFSDLLGTRLPGRGTGWMKQSLRLAAPARLDEPLTARVRIVRLRADKDLINLASVVTGADGRVLVQGESLVLVRNLADKAADRAA